MIASIAGLSARSTMDMDATIKGYPVTQKSIESMISEIIDIQLNDEVAFVLSSIKEIRETDDYAGYRAALKGEYANSKLAVDLKIDITTGDSISRRRLNTHIHYYLRIEVSQFWRIALLLYWQKKLKPYYPEVIRAQDREIITMSFYF